MIQLLVIAPIYLLLSRDLGRVGWTRWSLAGAAAVVPVGLWAVARYHWDGLTLTHTERFILQVVNGFRLDTRRPETARPRLLLMDATAAESAGRVLRRPGRYRLIESAPPGAPSGPRTIAVYPSAE